MTGHQIGRKNLHQKFEPGPQSQAIVQDTQDQDDHSAQEDAPHLLVHLGKQQDRQQKGNGNGQTAQPGNGHRVHSPRILGHVHRPHLIGHSLDYGRNAKGHRRRNQQRKQH